jgi:hypothetical protein
MSTYYERHPGLRLTGVEDEGIVLQLDTRRYFSVNESGFVILEALREPKTADELVEVLRSEYDVDPEHARASILRFLTSCQGSELVVRVDAARAIA